jgi:diadenosine tetraphosphate (Ap4A) HIT family hydrolase
MYRSRKVVKAYRSEVGKKLPKAGLHNCPFCDYRKDLLVLDGNRMIIIKNIFPYQYWEFMDVEDHLMVVPKRHVVSLLELNKEERLEAMELYAEYEAKGYNIYGRSDDNKIKTVAHQHTHLIKVSGKTAKAGFFSKKPYITLKI